MPVNILVADDSVTMRRIMEITFAGEDAEVVAVASGDAAVAKAAELRPDVVFADASMPGMDGYGVASAIKGSAGLEGTAVIVMASQRTPYDESKGNAAGVDDHILKPFDTQHVIDRVNQLLSKPRARPTGTAAAPAPRPPAPPAAKPIAPVAPAARPPKTATIAFGKPNIPAPAPAAAPRQAAPIAAPPVASAAAAATAAATAPGGGLAQKLDGLGLTPDQVDGVLSLSREVIERVVWEVVPDLAETLIKEEITRLTAD